MAKGPVVVHTKFLGGTNPTKYDPVNEFGEKLRNPRFYDVEVEGVKGGAAKVEISTTAFAPTKMQYYIGEKWHPVEVAEPKARISEGFPIASISGKIRVEHLKPRKPSDKRTPIVIGTN